MASYVLCILIKPNVLFSVRIYNGAMHTVESWATPPPGGGGLPLCIYLRRDRSKCLYTYKWVWTSVVLYASPHPHCHIVHNILISKGIVLHYMLDIHHVYVLSILYSHCLSICYVYVACSYSLQRSFVLCDNVACLYMSTLKRLLLSNCI